MTAADSPSTASMPSSSPQSAQLGDLVLRFLNTDHSGQWIRLDQTKCSIGSDDTCSLCLRTRFVQPLHALIVRGRERTIVRAYAADSRINGRPFEAAALAPGDTLSFGTVDLEVTALHHPIDEPVDAIQLRESSSGMPSPQRGELPPSEIESTLQSLSRAKQVNRARTRRLVCDLRDANERIIQQQERLEESNRRSQSLESRLNDLEERLAQLQSEYRQPEAMEAPAPPTVSPSECVSIQTATADEQVQNAPTAYSTQADASAKLSGEPAFPEIAPHPSTHSETGHGDTGHSDTGHSDTGHSEPEYSGTGHSESEYSEPDYFESDSGEAEQCDPKWHDPSATQFSAASETHSPFFEAADAGNAESFDGGTADESEDELNGETMSLTPELAQQLGIPYAQSPVEPLVSVDLDAEASPAMDEDDAVGSDLSALELPTDATAHDEQIASLRASLAGLLPEETKADEPFPSAPAMPEEVEGEPSQAVAVEHSTEDDTEDAIADESALPESTGQSDTKPLPVNVEPLVHVDAADDVAEVSLSEDATETALDSVELVQPQPSDSQEEADEDDEDESIEAYMAKLLQRVRGESEPGPETPSKITPPPSLTKSASKPSDASLAATATLEQAFADEIQARQREFSTPKVARRTEAPENRDELAVMRELANTSARSAIKESQQRRETQVIGIQVAGAGIAVLAGAALLRWAPSLLSLPVLAALGCWGGAGYLVYRAISWYRVKNTASQQNSSVPGQAIEVEIVPPGIAVQDNAQAQQTIGFAAPAVLSSGNTPPMLDSQIPPQAS